MDKSSFFVLSRASLLILFSAHGIQAQGRMHSCQSIKVIEADEGSAEIIKAAEEEPLIIESPGEDVDLWQKNFKAIAKGDTLIKVLQKLGGPSEIRSSKPGMDGFNEDRIHPQDPFSIGVESQNGSLQPKDSKWVYKDETVGFELEVIWANGRIESIQKIERHGGDDRPGFLTVPGEANQRWAKNFKQIEAGDEYIRVLRKLGGPSQPEFPHFIRKNGAVEVADDYWDYNDVYAKLNYSIRVNWRNGKVSSVEYRARPKNLAEAKKVDQKIEDDSAINNPKTEDGFQPRAMGLIMPSQAELRKAPKLVMIEDSRNPKKKINSLE